MAHRNRILVVAGLAVAVVVALVAGLAFAGGEEAANPEPTSTSSSTTTTTEPPAAPLTGVPVDDAGVLDRPALVVKVDNSTKARGRQAGLAAADVVFVERVEGGATRLAAVFHSTDALVGPVRSARTTDVEIVANLNRPLFAFSGANAGVLRIVRSADLVDVGWDAETSAYEEHGSGVLRLFVETSELFDRAPDGASPPPELFTFRADGAPLPASESVRGVRVDYGGQVDTAVLYELDRGSGRWERTQDGTPHVDADGDRIAPENVIVQFVSYRSSGFVDVAGAASPEAALVGEGDAWVLTGGRLVRGRWSRPGASAPTAYTDPAGNPIPLGPGRTWVELAPTGDATVLEPEPPPTSSTAATRSP